MTARSDRPWVLLDVIAALPATRAWSRLLGGKVAGYEPAGPTPSPPEMIARRSPLVP